MEQTKIKIGGMHCQSCVILIESELKKLEGINEVKVSLVDNEAEVKFDSEKIALSKIKDKIIDLNYTVDGKKKGKGFLQGLLYGLIPHIGCIAFIIGSILGVTVLMNFFKPLLMNRYFFHFLIGISLGFATLSSGLYLRKQRLLSWKGVKRKWKYLTAMYGSTVGINLVLFMLIFPLLANVGSNSITGAAIGEDLSTVTFKVDIPCPGHAPLISGELKTIEGVAGIEFSFPEYFEVSYDGEKTSKEEMLKLDVFDEYPAEVTDEKVVRQDQQAPTGGSCCGGAGTCGGGCGGCGAR